MKSILKNTALFCLGITASFLLVEAILASASMTPLGKVLPLVEPELGQPDKNIGYAFRPNAQGLWTRENSAYIKINALGHRDKEVTLEKPAGVTRIMLLGDSVTEALQVEHERTFEHIAEENLNAQNHAVEIVNLAMSGMGPLRQLVRLEHFGLPLSPDIAIFKFAPGGFTSGEMFDDSGNPGYKINNADNIERSYSYRTRLSQRLMENPAGKLYFFLIQNSHIFRKLNLKRKESLLKFLNLTLPELSINQQPKPPAKPQCNQNVFAPQYDLWIKHKPDHSWLAVEKFTEELTTHNLKSILMLRLPLPQKECPNDIRMRKEIIKFMSRYFKNHDMIFIDEMTEIAKTMGLRPYKNQEIQNLRGFGLSLGNGHLNYRGHRIYAKTLERVLQQYQNIIH